MKRKWLAFLTALVMALVSAAYADKARNIMSDMDSSHHAAHLAQHLNATDLRGTGNYLKVRMNAGESKVLGHLEQADRFVLLALKNGYAQVALTESADTSPDSWVGLTGWVNADYIDCDCSQAPYYSPTAADAQAQQNTPMPGEAAGQYIFCSGAGGWATYLTLLTNGTFWGSFSDEDMGGDNPSYPNGTQYFCDFSGQFTNLAQINDYSYALTLDALTVVPAKDHIQDGKLYIASAPYGVESGKAFILYLPNTPLNAMTEDFLMWMYGPLGAKTDATLGTYALYNQETGYAFFQ